MLSTGFRILDNIRKYKNFQKAIIDLISVDSIKSKFLF